MRVPEDHQPVDLALFNDLKPDSDLPKLIIAAGTGIMLHSLGDPSTGNLAYRLHAVEATMDKLGISGWRSWHETNKMIAERVGGELLRRRLWPIQDRILRGGYLD